MEEKIFFLDRIRAEKKDCSGQRDQFWSKKQMMKFLKKSSIENNGNKKERTNSPFCKIILN